MLRLELGRRQNLLPVFGANQVRDFAAYSAGRPVVALGVHRKHGAVGKLDEGDPGIRRVDASERDPAVAMEGN